jgi:heat shock protein HslJ
MRPVAAALLILVLLAACARFGTGGTGGTGGSGAGSPQPSHSGGPDLAGAWQLRRGTGPSGTLVIPAGARVTIAFDGKRVSGQACNLYGGDYQLHDDGTLTISAMSMTEMACQEPMMSLEAAYHAALALVRRASVASGQLTLSGEGAELVFSRVPKVPDASLVGTDWQLTTLFQGDVASSVVGQGWLQLDADGTLRGSTGCRGFDASYAVSGDRVEITGLVTEDNACEPAGAAQDRLVLDVLRGGIRFAIDGQQLTLTDSGIVGGSGLGYTAGQD